MKRVLWAWDVKDFGGHDVSALTAVEGLMRSSDVQVGVLQTGRNDRLTAALQDCQHRFPALDVLPLPMEKSRSECLDGLTGGRRTRQLEQAITRWQPDLVINVQGFITMGTCVTAAARRARIRLISYLPMTHRVSELFPGLISRVQDLVNLVWYQRPDRIVVTSHRMKEKLIKLHRVSPERISVVEYGPSSRMGVKWDRESARKELGLGDGTLVAVVGRVEFGQKNHDGFLQALHRYSDSLQGIKFLIVGEGPDLEAAQSLVRQYGLEEIVHFLPWIQDPGPVFGAMDLLLIPSRFEGVPLVMLEAMGQRVPVAGSAVDGMLDYLPEDCLFPPEDGWLMVETIRKTLAGTRDQLLDAQQKRIQDVVNAENFCQAFTRVIAAELEGTPPGAQPFPSEPQTKEAG